MSNSKGNNNASNNKRQGNSDRRTIRFSENYSNKEIRNSRCQKPAERTKTVVSMAPPPDDIKNK